jgi:hypothetical protein
MASSIGKSRYRDVMTRANRSFRLTTDIYPADLGWSVNWDKPEERQEWFHNMSSVLQAGPCVRTNQLDYDEEVMYKVREAITSTQ